jgi:hypothetical protein
MKLSIILCLFLCLAFGCSTANSDHATNTESNWEKRIISKHKHPYAYLISPHLGEVNVLIVDGHRFENVRGQKPFYLRVPETNAILFMVDEKDYSITFHYYNMDTKEHVSIHSIYDFLFGRQIGLATLEGANDTIEVAKNGEIVLCTKWGGARLDGSEFTSKEYTYLDIRKMRITAIKTFYYDKSGNLFREYDVPPPF